MKILARLIRSLLIVFILVLTPGTAISQELDKARLYDFVVKYFFVGSPYYGTGEMFEEMKAFPPREKTELWRLYRRKQMEDYRIGMGEEYRKRKIEMCPEDAAVEMFKKPFAELSQGFQKDAVFERCKVLEEHEYGPQRFDEDVFRKGVINDEIFAIAEDIALERYTAAFVDMPDEQMNAIMKEVFSIRPDLREELCKFEPCGPPTHP
jgi:hypothetical protein